MSARHIRAMAPDDVDAVVAIITDVDDEDGAEAATDFTEHGVDGHFVMTLGDDAAPAGVSGFRHVPATERTSWLSWTYLAREHRGQGHGRALIEHVVGYLRGARCRKVFVKVSDYVDPDEGPLYEAAIKTYETLGFTRELTAPDFHDERENLMIYGLPLAGNAAGDGNDGEEAPDIAEERPALEFVGLHEIDDSDGAYTFEWSAGRSSLLGKLGSLGKRAGFDKGDLMLGLEGVKRAGGRKVFLTFPSNLPAIHEPLKAAGFERIGQLDDYYERGLHELHFAHDLSGVP